jgi:hypothetical protein
MAVPLCAIHDAKDEECPITGADFLDKHASTPKEDQAVHHLEDTHNDFLGIPVVKKTMDHMIHFLWVVNDPCWENNESFTSNFEMIVEDCRQ